MIRVGIVGFGSLGQYLYQKLQSHTRFQVVFVWNRTKERVVEQSLPSSLILHNLAEFESFDPDVIIEVASPEITDQFGHNFLQRCHYVIGSPAALGNPETESRLQEASSRHGTSLYVPSGAFWGSFDVRKMSDMDTLKGLTVTMTFHPSALRVKEPLKSKNEAVEEEPVTLYDGPVRGVLELAPNNVNTLATAAIAARNLGFDAVRGILVSDPSHSLHHKITVEVTGPSLEGRQFKVMTTRISPSASGAVTSSATFDSFLASINRKFTKFLRLQKILEIAKDS